MNEPRAVADILTEALGYIEAGWTQGSRENVEGEVCIVGAIEKAVYGDVVYGPKPHGNVYKLPDLMGLHELLPDDAIAAACSNPASFFNDCASTTKDDVTSLVKAGIENAREKGLTYAPPSYKGFAGVEGGLG